MILHFSVDLSVNFEGLKRSDDNVIVIGTYYKGQSYMYQLNLTPICPTSSHLLCEQCDHLGEVDWAGSLADQVVGLSVGDRSPNVDKGGHEVLGCDDAVLVNVNDAKGFLKLLNLFLTEEGEDVGTRLLSLL